MDNEQKITLLKWRARTKRAQLAHSYSATSYARYHLTLGILLIILATGSTVLIFAENVPINWIPPVVGISAALFAYLQTFLQLSEKAITHRDVARKYGSLKKEIEYLVAFTPDADDLAQKVEQLRVRGDEISSTAPHALSRSWHKAKQETQEENDAASIRNNT